MKESEYINYVAHMLDESQGASLFVDDALADKIADGIMAKLNEIGIETQYVEDISISETPAEGQRFSISVERTNEAVYHAGYSENRLYPSSPNEPDWFEFDYEIVDKLSDRQKKAFAGIGLDISWPDETDLADHEAEKRMSSDGSGSISYFVTVQFIINDMMKFSAFAEKCRTGEISESKSDNIHYVVEILRCGTDGKVINGKTIAYVAKNEELSSYPDPMDYNDAMTLVQKYNRMPPRGFKNTKARVKIVKSDDEMRHDVEKIRDRMKFARKRDYMGKKPTAGAFGGHSRDFELRADIDKALDAVENYATWNSGIKPGSLLDIDDSADVIATYEDLPDFEKQHADSDVGAFQMSAAEKLDAVKQQWLVSVKATNGNVKEEQFVSAEDAKEAAKNWANSDPSIQVSITKWHDNGQGELVCDELPGIEFPVKPIRYLKLLPDRKHVNSRLKHLLRPPEKKAADAARQHEYDMAKPLKYGQGRAAGNKILYLKSKINRLHNIITDKRYADMLLTIGEIRKQKKQAMRDGDFQTVERLSRQENKLRQQKRAELNALGPEFAEGGMEDTVAKLKDVVIQLNSLTGPRGFTPGMLKKLRDIASKTNNAELADAIRKISG